MHELLSTVSSRELSEWLAFSSIEPIGDRRGDLRAAIIACVIANANRGKGKKALKIDDFMLKFDPPRQMSDAEIISVLKRFT